MFNTTDSGYSLADIAAATGNNNGAFGNDSGAWWIIILFLFAFAGGWGNNGGGLFGGNNATSSGITDGYVLTSDFASLERQMENGFDRLASQTTQVANGISSLGYDQLNQMNGINTNINNASNNIIASLTANEANRQQCCCNTNNLITTGLADLNYNLASQTCQTRQAVNDAASAITLNQDANTRSILTAIQDMQTQALQDKIAELTADKQALQFAASQAAQNTYLVNALSPNPTPAYVVPNPYTGSYGYRSCGCSATV